MFFVFFFSDITNIYSAMWKSIRFSDIEKIYVSAYRNFFNLVAFNTENNKYNYFVFSTSTLQEYLDCKHYLSARKYSALSVQLYRPVELQF